MLLYGALLTHMLLALAAFYRRRHLRVPGWELARIALGLLIPVLLLQHVVRTRLTHELAGIEVEHVMVGEPGYGRARSLTAIGDAVNVASRLEALNNQYGSELVISARVADLDTARLPALRMESLIRGRTNPLTIFVFGSAAHIRHEEPMCLRHASDNENRCDVTIS